MTQGNESVDIHRTAAQRLGDDEQRYTTGRRRIVEVLANAGRPVTIAELLDLDRSLAQSSAYRNLAVLEQSAIVHRVMGSDEFARFELTEDLAGHHHHLICSNCGSVADFTVSPSIEEALDGAMAAIATSTGFVAQHHRLDLVGLCSACQ